MSLLTRTRAVVAQTWRRLSAPRLPGDLVQSIASKSGWWFETLFFLFFHNIWDNPSQLTFIFFRGVGIPPTRNAKRIIFGDVWEFN